MTAKSNPSYVFSMDKITNVATAYNYISLFNPVGRFTIQLVGNSL